MDYEFVFDTKLKIHTLELMGEHVAIGDCLTSEMNPNLIENIDALMTKLSASTEMRLELTEWLVEMDNEEISFKHHNLVNSDNDEVNKQDWQYYCQCGKTDLLDMLGAWRYFVETN